MKKISIVIPVYNEEEEILSTIDSINKVMKKSDIAYEIIVVNDGSNDNTKEILNKSSQDFVYCQHIKNKGYGASLKTGIRLAKSDTICITDADGTYPNKDIPKLYNIFSENDYDMVVGKRSFGKLPLITKPAKWFISKLANYLVEFKIPDINSGLRIFKKGQVTKFFNIISDGFSFTTTITLAMLTNNLRVKYVPIEYYKRKGNSKIRPIYDTLNYIQLIIRTVLYFNPLKIFIPISLLLFILALFFLFYSWLFLTQLMDITVMMLFISAIQVFAIGLIADMIDKRL